MHCTTLEILTLDRIVTGGVKATVVAAAFGITGLAASRPDEIFKEVITLGHNIRVQC